MIDIGERPFATSRLDADAHGCEAARRRESGDALGALAHEIAATALRGWRAGVKDALAPLCVVAHGYFMKGDFAQARAWYELLLELDDGIASAWQNLAAMRAEAGDEEGARACRTRAYGLQRVFEEPVDLAQRRLLILCTGQGLGNIPLETLLSLGRSTRIKYVIDYAAEAEDDRLPAHDLVINAVGDPDAAVRLAPRLQAFARQCGRPLLNPPARVCETRRHQLGDLLRGLDDVLTAACIRRPRSDGSRDPLGCALDDAGLRFPVLARPVETHGGQGLRRCESLDELGDAVAGIDAAHYLTQFVDTRGADGWFRKYRIVFVDRQPFAYHLAISAHWMVHYFSADMPEHAWKLAEERRFLDDPEAALGTRAMRAVAAIGRRIDLDYAGIDFTVLPDGRVFVFEANATMLVHGERAGGPLAYRNAPVRRIAQAFEAMLIRRAGR